MGAARPIGARRPGASVAVQRAPNLLRYITLATATTPTRVPWPDRSSARFCVVRRAGVGVRRRLRALVFDVDTRGVEFLTAQLSLWFSLSLLTSDSPNRPQPVWFWPVWCGVAGLAKAAGFGAALDTSPPRWAHWSRLVGCLLGTVFWIVLATVLFSLARTGISWGGFAIIALAQAWCAFRVWREG